MSLADPTPPVVLSRRQWLQAIGLPTLSRTLAEQAVAAEPKPAILPPLNRFPRMVQEYFVARVRALEQANLRTQAALRTKADAEAYVRAVRERIRLCFGP